MESREDLYRRSQSNEQSNSTMFQAAGILLSMVNSPLPTYLGERGHFPGYSPYFPSPLIHLPQEKTQTQPLEIYSYGNGAYTSLLKAGNMQERALAIGYNGPNCFIPQRGDFTNGYLLHSPVYQAPRPLAVDSYWGTAAAPATTSTKPQGNHGNPAASATVGAVDQRDVISQSQDANVTTGIKCHICMKMYARLSTLKTHLRTHTGEKPFKCSICFKSFTQISNLTAHLRIHSGEKPFQCCVCNRRFAQSSSVTTHMRIHSGERPHKCKVCSRGFADRSTLTKHLRVHTGEKPYQCRVCDMRFSQSGNLRRHTNIHKNYGEFKIEKLEN